MAKLKIDGVITLHDARYCASQGVDYVGFGLGKGLPYKLPEATLAQILGWIEGSRPVIELGEDPDALAAFQEAHSVPDNTLVQVCYPADLPAAWPADRLIRQFKFHNPQQLAEMQPQIDEAADRCFGVQLTPLSTKDILLAELSMTLVTADNVFLQLDHFGIDCLAELAMPPRAIVLQQMVQTGDYQLDFDRFEAIWGRLGRESFEL